MAEYHVVCGMAGIYAGTVKPNGMEWENKSLVTDEAIAAVRDHMCGEIHAQAAGNARTGSVQYEWKAKDGRVVTLTLKVEEGEADGQV